MVKLEFASDSTQSRLLDAIYPIIERTGVILPLSIITLIILAFIYHDRLLFTKPYGPHMAKPPGALPLIGHSYTIVKNGTEQQFERFQEMALCESSLHPSTLLRY